MDGIKQQLIQLTNRYKYVLLVVLTGVLLMLLPMGSSDSGTTVSGEQSIQPAMDVLLEQILSQMQGVGEVRVMLTIARGEQILYIYDEDSSASEGSESTRRETVIITGQDRVQAGLVCQVISPVYQGAVVVCEGADQAAVRLQVVEAVCDATGLTADKVTVLKMK